MFIAILPRPSSGNDKPVVDSTVCCKDGTRLYHQWNQILTGRREGCPVCMLRVAINARTRWLALVCECDWLLRALATTLRLRSICTAANVRGTLKATMLRVAVLSSRASLYWDEDNLAGPHPLYYHPTVDSMYGLETTVCGCKSKSRTSMQCSIEAI
jgi:hypothetical protein